MSINKRYFGGYNVGDPPLPIPNREVKPNRADGTAYSGRVGSCQFWRRLLVVRLRVFSLFMPVPLSRIAEKRMYVLKRETMLRAKILNVFRADYGVCCTILIYPEEFVLSDY